MASKLIEKYEKKSKELHGVEHSCRESRVCIFVLRVCHQIRVAVSEVILTYAYGQGYL